MSKQKDQLLAYLKQDLLKHIVQLKAFLAYEASTEPHYAKIENAEGGLLLIPTQVTTYESVKYPDTEYMVLIATDTPLVTEQLLDHVPQGIPLIFKFINPQDKAVVAEKYSLKPVASYLSYTCPKTAKFISSSHVVVSKTLDQQLFPLFRENGYGAEEIEGYFHAGRGIAFTIYEMNQPVSVCMAYQNYDTVWEIAGLYTLPQTRRQGHGKQIVATALHTLLAKGYISRYQMIDTNLASKALAESLGLQLFLTTDHYLHYP